MKNQAISSIVLFLVSAALSAETKIAILDFELIDVTLAPRIPAEIQRTAAIKPMLEAELKKAGYQIVSINLQNQHRANAGVSYLFEHHDVAAALAKQAGADYILVGKLHKPSFLFAYLIGHLINADKGVQLGSYTVETKGGDKKLTLKAVETFADLLDNDLDKKYTPPPPVKTTY